ncbi:hypothetical protein [Aneurinibacillus terranovensis]|uniref:hypothetical protein n=1 Tax=Aneurinibacillus terranovensis TaxID=278991 RepID=UPI0012DD6966
MESNTRPDSYCGNGGSHQTATHRCHSPKHDFRMILMEITVVDLFLGYYCA